MSNRRAFIKRTAFATAGTMLIPNFLKAFSREYASPLEGDNILVIIQLSGGNDGLNTIVPYRNDLYFSYRPQLAIPQTSVLKASDDLGFHPSLVKLNALYEKGYLGVVNNVGYPNPDRSHFRSMDIWQTASNASDYLTTGWIGRYLDSSCMNCSAAHKAIEIDDTLGVALKGESTKGMALKHPAKLHKLVHSSFIQQVNENHQKGKLQNPSLHYLYKTLAETTSSADYIYDKSKVRQSNATYPDHEFASRLKTVASLINAGIETKVYYISLSGFDTHVRQSQQHSRLLEVYADAVYSFVNDLEKNNRFNNVLVMTFSEFGRRVAENASAGTDHGTANNLFIIGKDIKQKGFLNGTPDLNKLDDGDLIHRVDFRSIYATLLEKWLAVEHTKILSNKFQVLDFI